MMYPRIRVKEFSELDLQDGYLIDGFPSVGFSSAIATESMIHMTKFELAGIVDSDNFPAISVIKNGEPNYPTRIFVNKELKVGIFLSYLTLDQLMHRVVAKTMLKWAKKHKIGLIVSSIAIKSSKNNADIMGIGSTDSARLKIKNSGLKMLEHGTIPGIPGMLLNESRLSGQDVIVLVFHTSGAGPDFKSSAELCLAMSKLIPGTSCDVASLQKEAEKAEIIIKETEEESKHLRDSMYR